MAIKAHRAFSLQEVNALFNRIRIPLQNVTHCHKKNRKMQHTQTVQPSPSGVCHGRSGQCPESPAL